MIGQCYGICYKDGHLVAIPNPPNPNLKGFVYGTIKNHTSSDSAIAEYREYVKTKIQATDAESYAEKVLKDLPCLKELAENMHSLCKITINR